MTIFVQSDHDFVGIPDYQCMMKPGKDHTASCRWKNQDFRVTPIKSEAQYKDIILTKLTITFSVEAWEPPAAMFSVSCFVSEEVEVKRWVIVSVHKYLLSGSCGQLKKEKDLPHFSTGWSNWFLEHCFLTVMYCFDTKAFNNIFMLQKDVISMIFYTNVMDGLTMEKLGNTISYQSTVHRLPSLLN